MKDIGYYCAWHDFITFVQFCWQITNYLGIIKAIATLLKITTLYDVFTKAGWDTVYSLYTDLWCSYNSYLPSNERIHSRKFWGDVPALKRERNGGKTSETANTEL